LQWLTLLDPRHSSPAVIFQVMPEARGPQILIKKTQSFRKSFKDKLYVLYFLEFPKNLINMIFRYWKYRGSIRFEIAYRKLYKRGALSQRYDYESNKGPLGLKLLIQD
jgi:hypothetical protein